MNRYEYLSPTQVEQNSQHAAAQLNRNVFSSHVNCLYVMFILLGLTGRLLHDCCPAAVKLLSPVCGCGTAHVDIGRPEMSKFYLF